MLARPTRSALFAAPALLVVLLVQAAGCGDDDGPSLVDAGPDTGRPGVDAGPPCTSDGTPAGDCMRFSCEVAKASAVHCAGTGSTVTFNCTGVESFPPDYLTLLSSYFNDCAPELAGYVATDVETMSGPVTITACQILKCSTEFLSQRSPAPMVIRAECAPVPAPACDLPDPPMP